MGQGILGGVCIGYAEAQPLPFLLEKMMGVCYNLILLDEFDFTYANSTKTERLENFCKEYREAGAYACALEATWYGAAVFDVDKCGPYNAKYREVIRKFSDNAYFIADNELYKIYSIDDIS